MLVLLFFTALIWFCLGIIIFHYSNRSQIDVSLRENFLLAALLLGLIVVVLTEGLSLFKLLTPEVLRIAWSVIVVLTLGWAGYLIKPGSNLQHSLKVVFQTKLTKLKNQSWGFYLIIALIVIQIIALLVIIYLYPIPNNGDSMRYHMTRVLRWEAQASVDHFATHNLNQISFPPFAEYVILHINLLMGNDHLSRIVQWFAMVVSIMAVSDVARRIGANSRQQLIAALICTTIPMVIVQATTTMNDLVVAAWLVCFLAFGLRFKSEPRNLFWAVATGAALGLAILTKGTAYVIAFPLVVWIAVDVIKAEGFRLPVWKAGAVILALVLLINTGHSTRNTIVFGNPIEDAGTINEVISLRAFASNSIRNIQNHFPAENQKYPKPLNRVLGALSDASLKLNQITGFDIEDPRITFEGNYTGFESPGGADTGEMKAGAFLDLVLIIITIAVNLFWFRDKRSNSYVFAMIGVAVFFSLLLKAHTMGNRLQLPIFVLWSPVIAVTLFRSGKRYWAVFPILIWLFSLPWVVNNPHRPLIPQKALASIQLKSLENRAYFESDYKFLIYDRLTDFILESQCTEVGISAQEFDRVIDVIEYPFWMMLQAKGFTGRIEHYLVQNESKMYEDPQFTPCAIFSNQEITSLPNFTGTYFGAFAKNEIWVYILNAP